MCTSQPSLGLKPLSSEAGRVVTFLENITFLIKGPITQVLSQTEATLDTKNALIAL